MADIHPYEVLRRPLVTEKYTALQDGGKYAFEVAKKANKKQIKEAVEIAFNVKVHDVNTSNVHGKTKRVGMRLYQKSDWKKAVVTLKEGERIQIFEGV